jgi:chaperonin GroEL
LRFDRGYVSPYFVTDEKKQKIEFENCYILAIEKKLSNLQELLPYLEFTYKQQKPLLIICEDIESEILATLIINRLKSNLKICVVKAPSFGDNRKAIMQDISIFTGGQYFAEEAGVFLDKNAEDPDILKASFGIAKNVTITKEDTIIVGGKG